MVARITLLIFVITSLGCETEPATEVQNMNGRPLRLRQPLTIQQKGRPKATLL